MISKSLGKPITECNYLDLKELVRCPVINCVSKKIARSLKLPELRMMVKCSWWIGLSDLMKMWIDLTQSLISILTVRTIEPLLALTDPCFSRISFYRSMISASVSGKKESQSPFSKVIITKTVWLLVEDFPLSDQEWSLLEETTDKLMFGTLWIRVIRKPWPIRLLPVEFPVLDSIRICQILLYSLLEIFLFLVFRWLRWYAPYYRSPL
jgi:hypothetical protein